MNDTRIESIRKQEDEATIQAFNRAKEAVQAGDIQAFRAAFDGRGGYLLGLSSGEYGNMERMVLTEMIDNTDAPLDLLRVFFLELGGRYWVNRKVCVYSILMDIDLEVLWHPEEENAEENFRRYAERMPVIVDYMVNTLEMPIPRLRSVRPQFTSGGPLMALAWENGAWASWAAFVKHIPAYYYAEHTAYGILINMIKWRTASPYSRFWFARCVPDITDNQLEALLQTVDEEEAHLPRQPACFFRPHLKAEAERRQTLRIHARALFMLPEQNAPGAVVQAEPSLVQMIMAMAYAECRF